MKMTGTYSPEDNKLRLYASTRLDAETYARVKAAGFGWAPKQDLFVAPAWTPQREDLLLELCGEIGDEDMSLAERAEERAERFDDYSEARADDATAAQSAVARIADGIPLGQPILVGHHSERHARKDAARIENGMRRAVRMWDTSKYWQARAAGAIRNAKYKELPSVRARRIKGLEAEERKCLRSKAHAESDIRAWKAIDDPAQFKRKDGQPTTLHERARFVANVCHVSRCFPLADFPRVAPACQYEGSMGLWSALGDTSAEAIITPEQAQAFAVEANERSVAWAQRWLDHLANRLEYERTMLAGQGGTVADKTGPAVGGAVRCWASHRGGWSYVRKVNKVSVTVEDNWGNGGRNFTRTVPFDKLAAVMSPDAVTAARESGQLVEIEDKTGFLLRSAPVPPPLPPKAPEPEAAPFEAMREQLRAGVQVIAAPQLFPTPVELARRMIEAARLKPGHRILEPSAGTGRLIDAAALSAWEWSGELVAVEHSAALAAGLRAKYRPEHVRVVEGDFMACNGELGTFDRILMNPPFAKAADVEHITHALKFLKPGGRLVAICSGGPRQQAMLGQLVRKRGGTWKELPSGTFEGTGVRSVLLSIQAVES
jgi:protein-L-isoaspartate O-methyltransferase